MDNEMILEKEKTQDKLIKENNLLGFEKNNIEKIDYNIAYKLTPFFVDENMITGFWCDPDIDSDTKTRDIVFYVMGTSFRTPNTQGIKNLFLKILTKREKHENCDSYTK
jgi:hypothetical protein